MSGNVCPNMVMIILRDLIGTQLYKNLNVIAHHQWASLFTLHMDLEFQIFNSSDASFDNFNFDNEELHCTTTNLMIHNFLESPKKWIMKILYMPQVNIFTF
jgi:hypothetical protein